MSKQRRLGRVLTIGNAVQIGRSWCKLRIVKDDGLHMNDWAYDCTARLLARAIIEAVGRTAPVL